MREQILESIANSVMRIHVERCGSPLSPTHNSACLIAFYRFRETSTK